MKSNYNERKERRIERFKELAAKNEAKSEQQFKRASELASVIPFGQPILVGHHSERSDRNYRKKIERLSDKAVESGKKANYYDHRAAIAESNHAISSDDPDAINKLKEKLKGMEKLQEFMKAVNKIVKAKKTFEADKISKLLAMNIKEGVAKSLLQPDYIGRTGFANYQLQNNNQNIARVKKRIAELESLSAMQSSEVMIGNVKIKTNVEDNRMQIFFAGKPEEQVRKELKRHGFRWSPSVGAWQRQISNQAAYFAREIVTKMNNSGKGE